MQQLNQFKEFHDALIKKIALSFGVSFEDTLVEFRSVEYSRGREVVRRSWPQFSKEELSSITSRVLVER
jgi:capsid protein